MAPLTRGIGKQMQVGVALETVRGTAKTSPATSVFWLAVDDWAMEERFNNAIDVQTYGLIEDNVNQTRVKNWAEGELTLPIGATTAAVIFRALFGSCTTVTHAGETTVFDNTIGIAQDVQHDSLTLLIHDPIATPAIGTTPDYTHANTVVGKAEINYELGDFVKMTATMRGLTGSAAAVAFVPSQALENRFVPQYLTFKTASSFAGLGAASAIKIKSAKITIDENVEDDDVLGSTSPRDFLNKEFHIEGTIEAIWQNESDFKQAALANTFKAMRLDCVNSDVTTGVASTNPQFRIDFARVHFTEFSRPVKIKDVMYQTITFQAAYSITDGFMVRVLFVNGVNIGAL